MQTNYYFSRSIKLLQVFILYIILSNYINIYYINYYKYLLNIIYMRIYIVRLKFFK